MQTKHKIILVDDNDTLRQVLKLVLAQIESVEVIAEASNGKDFLQIIQSHEPDLVLMDIDMPIMNGLEATKIIHELKPDLKIMALSMYGNEEHYFGMIHAGASGFVIKESALEELQKGMETIMRGEHYFSPQLLKNIIINVPQKNVLQTDTLPNNELNDTEMSVLVQLCYGHSDFEIADILNMDSNTVEEIHSHLLLKTNSKNTVSLVMYAIKNKLVGIEDSNN